MPTGTFGVIGITGPVAGMASSWYLLRQQSNLRAAISGNRQEKHNEAIEEYDETR